MFSVDQVEFLQGVRRAVLFYATGTQPKALKRLGAEILAVAPHLGPLDLRESPFVAADTVIVFNKDSALGPRLLWPMYLEA